MTALPSPVAVAGIESVLQRAETEGALRVGLIPGGSRLTWEAPRTFYKRAKTLIIARTNNAVIL